MSSCPAWVLLFTPTTGCKRDSEGCLVLFPRARWKDTVHVAVMYDHSALRERGLQSVQGENATEMHFIS